MDTNIIVISGRLTRDMETKYTAGGLAIGKFAIATNRRTKSGDEWKDEASFFDCTVFGKTAENLGQYMVKGKQVVITGELKQDRWEKDGQQHSRVGINVNQVQLIGGEKGNTAPAPSAKPFDDDYPDSTPF